MQVADLQRGITTNRILLRPDGGSLGLPSRRASQLRHVTTIVNTVLRHQDPIPHTQHVLREPWRPTAGTDARWPREPSRRRRV